jgi:hypothetical protein
VPAGAAGKREAERVFRTRGSQEGCWGLLKLAWGGEESGGEWRRVERRVEESGGEWRRVEESGALEAQRGRQAKRDSGYAPVA